MRLKGWRRRRGKEVLLWLLNAAGERGTKEGDAPSRSSAVKAVVDCDNGGDGSSTLEEEPAHDDEGVEGEEEEEPDRAIRTETVSGLVEPPV